MTQFNGTFSQLIKWSLRRTVMLSVVLFGGAFAVYGQTSNAPEPDYSNVNDILDGQRTLVEIDDLVIMGYYSTGGSFAGGESLTFKTSNSQAARGVLSQWSATGRATQIKTKTYSARMWNLPSATPMALSWGSGEPARIALPYLPDITNSRKVYFFYSIFGPSYPDPTGLAVADFNQDGYDDLILNFTDGTTVVATAGDVNNFKAGSSPPFNYGPASKLDPLADMTVGDFNGDGQPEVAGLVPLPSGGLALVIYTVDPKTLAVSKVAQITIQKAGTGSIAALSIASGRFTPAAHDQIIVASTPTGVQRTTLELIDFAPSSLTPQEQTTYAFNSGFLPAGGLIKVKTGHFGLPTSPYSQVAFMFAWTGYPGRQGDLTKYLNVLSIDPATLAWTPGSFNDSSGFDCAFDMTVGNFDHRQPDSNNPGETQHNFNNQIALLYGSCNHRGAKAINILNVDPGNFSISATSVTPLSFYVNDPNNWVALSFAQSDTQGRSYVLGAPTKVVVEGSIQPSVIAAMPPMHVDFVPPAGGSKPELLNLSTIPRGFRTTYQTNETKTNQSSTINTTSWSFGARQSFGVEYEVGSVDAGLGLKGSSVSTAAQDLKGSLETEHGRYTQSAFDASVTTGFSDSVWYSSSRFNIYVYPVLGKTVCPAGTGDKCPDDQKKPLTIQFSAPDQIQYDRRDGALLPWYQPPWEPGNVFSYPATYQQLQDIAPSLNLLSNPRALSTDTSTATESINWTTENTSGVTASFDQNYSFSQEFSVTGAVSTPLTSTTVTGTLNFNGSFGFSDLNKSITSLGKSTGIGVSKPGTFATPGYYVYSFTPYIFGQNQSGSVVDEEPLDADVETHGLLRTAFVADPAANDAGGWWKQTYNVPDVALNHPLRWFVREVAVENPLPPNCLNVGFGGTNMDCVTPLPRDPANPWLSLFHTMRGFFISNARNPGQGPQLTTAQAGDQLTLQARVYNYSFQAMPPESRVHVRFYAQPWNKDTHKPVGDSVLIGNQDVVLDPISPFSDDNGAPRNWVLARTNFDTTPYGGQSLVFWVIVWMQDANGNLIQEMPGHGLTSIPGVLKSFADIEMEEKYSNNVGFYNSQFYVFPDNASLTASGSGEPGTINIGKIQVSSPNAVPGQILDVSAQLSATNNSASGVAAVFYDGDPAAGGTAFGYELSPYIAENDTYQVKAPYVASACSTHQLFIVVGKGTPGEIVRRAPPVRVDCASSLLKHPNAQSR